MRPRVINTGAKHLSILHSVRLGVLGRSSYQSLVCVNSELTDHYGNVQLVFTHLDVSRNSDLFRVERQALTVVLSVGNTPYLKTVEK